MPAQAASGPNTAIVHPRVLRQFAFIEHKQADHAGALDQRPCGNYGRRHLALKDTDLAVGAGHQTGTRRQVDLQLASPRERIGGVEDTAHPNIHQQFMPIEHQRRRHPGMQARRGCLWKPCLKP